jgi:phosphoribosylamine-glycine ligase
MTPALEERVMAEIIRPTLAGMKQRGTPFKGILFAGLMITAQGPKLIEYNVRFGDPECEVLMPRANGGRVLAVTATGDSVTAAQAAAYAAVDIIDFPTGFCRRDIGWRAVEREHAANLA